MGRQVVYIERAVPRIAERLNAKKAGKCSFFSLSRRERFLFLAGILVQSVCVFFARRN